MCKLNLRREKYYKNITKKLFLYYKYIHIIDFFLENNKIYMKKIQKNKIYTSMNFI